MINRKDIGGSLCSGFLVAHGLGWMRHRQVIAQSCVKLYSGSSLDHFKFIGLDCWKGWFLVMAELFISVLRWENQRTFWRTWNFRRLLKERMLWTETFRDYGNGWPRATCVVSLTLLGFHLCTQWMPLIRCIQDNGWGLECSSMAEEGKKFLDFYDNFIPELDSQC